MKKIKYQQHEKQSNQKFNSSGFAHVLSLQQKIYVVPIEISIILLTINERPHSSKSKPLSISRNDEDELPIVPSTPIDRLTKWTLSYLFCSSETNFLYFTYLIIIIHKPWSNPELLSY